MTILLFPVVSRRQNRCFQWSDLQLDNDTYIVAMKLWGPFLPSSARKVLKNRSAICGLKGIRMPAEANRIRISVSSMN